MRRARVLISLAALSLTIVSIHLVIAWPTGILPPRPPRPRPTRPSSPPIPSTRDFAVPVLMYHHVCNLTKRQARNAILRELTVSPERFEQQMRYLVDNGFVVLRLRQIEQAVREGLPLPKKAVAVTIDDGYADVFEEAFPILRKYRIPATVFVTTGVVGTRKHISWNDILVMRDGRYRHTIEGAVPVLRKCRVPAPASCPTGTSAIPDRLSWDYGLVPSGQQIDCACHTAHHYDLTSLSRARLDDELCDSKRVMEKWLGEPVDVIAYPGGKHNRLVVAQAESAGYLAAWVAGGGPVRPSDDIYRLPRMRVRGSTTARQFARKVWSGAYLINQRESDQAAGRGAGIAAENGVTRPQSH